MSLSEATSARVNIPGPGGHPASSGRSPGTELRAGSAGWNRGDGSLHSSIPGPARHVKHSRALPKSVASVATGERARRESASCSSVTSPPDPGPRKEAPRGRCTGAGEPLQGSGGWSYANFQSLRATSQYSPCSPEHTRNALRDGK